MIIGIIGSGQLGYMMINTMRRYPFEFYVIDDNKGPSAYIADKFFYNKDYKNFVDSCDYVTYEFEHVSGEILKYADEQNKLRPSLKAVNLKKNRILEKRFLKENNFPVADFEYTESFKDAFKIAQSMGRGVIKSCLGGYDGKNQYFIDPSSKYKEEKDMPYVVEKFIDYDYESSIIAARDKNGNFEYFEPSYNYNQNGILIYNIAPINNNIEMIEICKRLMNKLDYTGVMGIEYYIKGDKTIINEYAPRVHNTGHHTLTGSSVSQFEEHILAVSGLTLIKPVMFVPSGILNIIGTGIGNKTEEILNAGNTNIYWYHKNEVRRKRKMGHINVFGDTYNDVKNRIDLLIKILYDGDVSSYI